MAISKEIENEYGVKFNYHKIADVRLLITEDNIQLKMKVDSYANKQARIDGKHPISQIYVIDNVDFALQPFYMLLKNKFNVINGDDDFDNSFKEHKVHPRTFSRQSLMSGLLERWQEDTGEAVEVDEVSDEAAAGENEILSEQTEEAAAETTEEELLTVENIIEEGNIEELPEETDPEVQEE